MISWIGILKILIQLGLSISQYIRDKQLMDAGEAKNIARGLAQITKDLGLDKEIEEEIALLSDKEARDRLKEDALP